MDPLAAGRRIASLIGKADDAPRVIRAYHGSPHSFSRFDASKIGTGEGAQSYGHGLYFAGNELVARAYRDALERMVMPQTPEEMASDYLRTWHRPDAARQMAETHLQDAASYRIPDERQALIRAAIELMDSGKAKVMGRRGHMYEVEIGYPEEALLDWDKPVGAALAGRLDSRMAGDLAEEAQRMASMGQLPRHMQVLNRIAAGEPGLATGEMVYRAAGRFEPPASRPGWGSVTSTINDSVTNQARASERLLDAGIPGIRYLDQGSRSAGEGTRNYVMFPGTEDRIRILRQYGLLPPVAAAGIDSEGE